MPGHARERGESELLFHGCPKYRGPLTEVEGEVVCAECGFVVEAVARKPFVREEKIYEEELSMLAVKSSFPTSKPDIRDAREEVRRDVARLAKLAKRVESSAWRSRYVSAARFASALAEELRLPSTCLYSALKRVKAVLASGAADGVSTKALTALTLFDAAREGGGRPVSLKDVRRAMRRLGSLVSNYVMFKLNMLLHERGFFKTRPYSAAAYVSYVVDKLKSVVEGDVAAWNTIADRARSLLASLDEDKVVRKNPLVLAATAVYAAWRLLGRGPKLSQRVVAEAVGISEYALRERFLKTFPQLVRCRVRRCAKQRKDQQIA